MGDCGEIIVIYKYTDIHNPHICNIVIIIACLNQHCPSILGRTAEATAVFGCPYCEAQASLHRFPFVKPRPLFTDSLL